MGGRNIRTVSVLPTLLTTPARDLTSRNEQEIKNMYTTTDTRLKVTDDRVRKCSSSKRRALISIICYFSQVFLKKIPGQTVVDKRKKRPPAKFPPSPMFSTRDQKKSSIMILAQHELRKVARKAGYFYVSGFSYLAKVMIVFILIWQFL